MSNKFSTEQINLLMSVIDLWYLSWKKRMTDNGDPHRLGFAKEELKLFISENLKDE